MKSRALGYLILASAVVAAGVTIITGGGGQETVAQPVSTATTESTAPSYTRDELYAGVYNGGQSTSWDMQEIDLFSPYPQGYKPEQPIKFSHRLHIEKNGMECQYCHSGVTKSIFPTIPSVESCMGCHSHVKVESPEIQKLKKLYDDKVPVEWKPVNNLPQHAHFNHERHMKAGVGCQTCHGQVQKMEVVEKAASLKMGFCVDCHRHRGASIDCAVCHY